MTAVAMGHYLDLALSATLLGGLYAIMAYGLGIIYGVLRVVNLAHGGLIMLGAYLTWELFTRLHLDPFLALPIVFAVFAVGGTLLYRLLVSRLPRGAAGGVQSLLLLFGVWLLLQNAAYQIFGGNTVAVRTTYSTNSLLVLGGYYSIDRILIFVLAIMMFLILEIMLKHTYLGKSIRAVAQNSNSCLLVGIDVERVYSITFAIGCGLAGLAGGVAATLFSFNPAFGSNELLKSFAIIVLGGLGSIVGMLAGAFVLAFTEIFSSLIMPDYLSGAVAFVLLVMVLIFRPSGLFGYKVLS
jgi:branched-chain amino acid transport system permease protein